MLLADLWNAVRADADYAPASLATEGFIHCSESPEQLLTVANTLYADCDADWVILVIAEARVSNPLRWESVDGARFPHLYGVLNLDAVERVVPFPRAGNKRFVLPAALAIEPRE